ncbi:MAG TPA: sigma-70 family RNA polymerase sigma factor [Cytophagaceae bacterium]|jgi:RNA polymerase sigma factor (sigma-70 family)|nr:sigma-70 family RNA polymerase sigma factor [Cytophagaceae bacterium]
MEDITLILNSTMSVQQNDLIRDTVKKERGRLLDFIRKRVSSEEDAEDILQDVFYELVETYRLMKPIEKVASWMFTVARNKITDRYRKKKTLSLENQVGFSDEDERLNFEELLEDFSESADSELIRNIIIEALNEALDELPDEQRTVFMLHEVEDRSFQEISEMTGVSINTLLSRKRYAVLFLRKRLKSVYEEINKY